LPRSVWIGFQRGAVLLRNLPAALPLFVAGSPVRRLIRRRPELVLNITTKPFITNRWNAKERVAALIDHCHTVDRMGDPMDFPDAGSVEVLRLDRIEGSYRLKLEQSRWLQMEGLITFGLYEGTDRFFHLSFCLSSRSGQAIAYIGGIQGVLKPDGLDQHRRFTKRTCGMRPRDFLVETFKLFCCSIGVRKILAVSDSEHANSFAAKGTLPPTYDRLWIERGGELGEDGFFALSPMLKRRPKNEIPKRKQGLYRRRYELLELISQDFFSRAADDSR